MKRIIKVLIWLGVAAAGALALATIAFHRGEKGINATWLVVAALCTYALGYRFYSKFIAAKVLALDAMRATPAERLENGRDFVRTNKWYVFGHHFAAIAGPGPLVGPVLAAQFGYLPSTIWILAGAVFGGCVQDFVILLFSVRRDGKSLGQMARDEISKVAGTVAFIAVISILVILLAVVALVIVNALRQSPWGTFTIGMTIPIALLMGTYLRYVRPGKVLEASIMGFALVMLAVFGGQWVSHSSTLAGMFTFSGTTLAVLLIAYGFAASAVPVWLLLAPRDYLSTFVKLGTIAILVIGIILIRPTLQMPALTRFIDGTGPVFAGSIFPFAFITVACGAISGFHSLISSGTTPKMIAREPQARMVGYGAMLSESLVGIMAIIAACTLQPGTYYAVNSGAGMVAQTSQAPKLQEAQAVATISQWGFPVTSQQMDDLAGHVGEKTLFFRTGGAPAFALGMAKIFSDSLGGTAVMAIWYHFAIMFEALFILTVLDAGTRVARFMVQDALGHVWAPMGRTSSYPSILVTSALVVAAWGYFLWQGLNDPLGGINSLWPLFGICNQLLATVALCVATTIIVKMGRARYMWVTLLPLAWLMAVTFTAAVEKIFHSNPLIGMLSHANQLLATKPAPAELARKVFNDRLDAAVAGFLLVLVAAIIIESAVHWVRVISGRKEASTREAPFVATRYAAEEPA
ncbi:MAG TPA: carbon starvation CstA family protein [Candidatus Angelobacter sp.]